MDAIRPRFTYKVGMGRRNRRVVQYDVVTGFSANCDQRLSQFEILRRLTDGILATEEGHNTLQWVRQQVEYSPIRELGPFLPVHLYYHLHFVCRVLGGKFRGPLIAPVSMGACDA